MIGNSSLKQHVAVVMCAGGHGEEVENGSYSVEDGQKLGQQAVKRGNVEKIEYRERAQDTSRSNGSISRSAKSSCRDRSRSGPIESTGEKIGNGKKAAGRDGRLQGPACAERKRVEEL